MKKNLLFVLMCVCATMSTWAQDYYSGESKTWTSCDNQSVQETAFIFTINTPGKLSDALRSTQSTYQIAKIKGELNTDDIGALSSITAETIDLQDAYYMENGKKKAFTFTNSSVRNLILPDNWTKAEVNDAAQKVNANLGSAISLGTFKDADGSDFASGSTFAGKTAITAYVNTSKTLRDALIRTYSEESNTKFGSGGFNQSTLDWSNIYGITISGYAVAQDFFKESLDFTAEGHIVFDREANEKERIKANDVRNIVGTGANKKPAFYCNTLGPGGVVSLDLSGVIIDDVYNSDLTLSASGASSDVVGPKTRQVCIPTCSSLKTLPADFLNMNGNGVNQICIPGNIQIIKTRAFQNTRLDHVWTTGNESDIRYDNGIYVLENNEEVMHEGYLSYASPNSSSMDNTYYLYGTYTLPSNLKLIESNAFCYENDAKVKDVYVLAIETPECHVDAFSTIMYTGNNTFDSQSISSDGIVTREAYVQSRARHNYITMLHYPRECGTPYIQRYTDPTREYSIATGMVDGKGATIYFPNQNEFLRAYSQGTYGYVWNAWDPTRSTDGSNEIANIRSQDPYTQTGQIQANGLYTSNQVFTAKSDRTFYDTTDGGNLTKPAGQGDYWDVYWEGEQLYPQPVYSSESYYKYEVASQTDFENGIQFYSKSGDEYTSVSPSTYAEGYYKRVQRQKVDVNGNLVFNSCDNGHFVMDYNYVPAENGQYVQIATLNSYVGTQTPVDGVSTYYSDQNGNEATPKVQDGYYVQDGTNPVYTMVDKNNDAIGAQDQYYTKNGDTYTESFLMFNNTFYYYSEEGEVKGWVQEYGYTNPTANHYTSQDLTTTPITSSDSGFGWNTLYWVYYTDVIHYIPSDHFIPGKTWYSYDQNNQTYTQKTLSWYDPITGDYYYVSGREPKYVSANGQDYNASETYYTSNTGETVVNPVNFDNTYYYATYDYSYEVYNGQTTGTRVEQIEYYREWTESDGNVQRYCPDMDDVLFHDVVKSNDYRGWHQFVLTGYAHNKNYEMEPYRSYITDNDWWTVCLPFDLTYDDMILFFGSENGTKPYLSKLTYVVRDVEKEKITLMFSKNLMEYKETVASGKVHGTISTTASAPASNEVVLHKGVPYLIKPNLKTKIDDNGNVVIDADRTFDIKKEMYHTSDDDNCLYCRLHKSSTMQNGDEQMDIVHKGIYTVPAYVINNNGEKAETYFDDNLTIALEDGSSNTYSNGKLTFKGTEYDAVVSNKFTYSFVGSFYLSLMPQYSYFLGWDSNNDCAAFWYNRVNNKQEYTWNNNTGIICPNWLTLPLLDPTKKRIHRASGVADPARWTEKDGFAMKVANDDFGTNGSVSNSKVYDMDFGGEYIFVEHGIATSVQVLPTQVMERVQSVYTANGVYVGTTIKGLPKGIYVVNGKKYVVK